MHLEDSKDLTPLAERIAETLQPGDALLIKASRGMRLERLVALLKRHTVES
jgi:UDP-N-acetylmuramyl pentapeptide synthase